VPVKNEPGYSTEQIENDLGGVRGAVDAMGEYAEFTTAVVAGVVVAQQPATSTEPMTQETWHSFNPLSDSWLVPAGGYAKYRITPMNELQICAWIKAPGASVNGMTIATFPVGYRPLSVQGLPCGADGINAAATGNGFFTVDTSGNLQSTGILTSANCYINGKIPLDV
jgi:hypothetical protein